MNRRSLRSLVLLALVLLVVLFVEMAAAAAPPAPETEPTLQAAPTAPPVEIVWRDDFGSATLDARWSWVREDPTHWSLTDRPGFLRITTQEGTLYENVNNAKNLLLQPAPAGDFVIETRVLFEPVQNIQGAGLMVYQDDDNVFSLEHAFCNFDGLCTGNGIYFDREEKGQNVGSNFATPAAVPDEAYLRLKRQGRTYAAYYSTNGSDWALIGTHEASAGFVPGKVGLWANNSTFGAAETPADFDYFALESQAHRVLLPLVMKAPAPPALPYRLVPDSAVCLPNAGVAYYQGVVRDRSGALKNGVCVHVAFYGPRQTKCSGCDGVGDGNWGFAPFGSNDPPLGMQVDIFVVPCPAYMPPGGQNGDWGDLTPLSDKWTYTTTAIKTACTGITFQEN